MSGWPQSGQVCERCGDWPCSDAADAVAPTHYEDETPLDMEERLARAQFEALLARYGTLCTRKAKIMTEAQTITREQANELRDKLRVFRAAQKAKQQAREERRSERMGEIENHQTEMQAASELIKSHNDAIVRITTNIDVVHEQLEELRGQLKVLKEEREQHSQERDVALANRNAARKALRDLRAEIRGV